VVFYAALKFLTLGLGKQGRMGLRGNAFPDSLGQSDAVFNAQAVNA
jgi:hypothetical protein